MSRPSQTSSTIPRGPAGGRSLARQLFVSIFGLVLVTIVLGAVTGAVLASRADYISQQQSMARVQADLRDGNFPLTEQVLHQLSALSRLDFVTVSPSGLVLSSTLRDALCPVEEQLASQFEARERAVIAPPARSTDAPVVLRCGDGATYRATRCERRVPNVADGVATVWVLARDEGWLGLLWRTSMPPLLAGGVLAVLAVPLSLSLARQVAEPVRQLSEYAGRVAGGHDEPVEIAPAPVELMELGWALSQMSEKLRHNRAELVRHERLRTLGQLSAGLAHQLRNSATGARLALDLVQTQVGATADLAEPLEIARTQLSSIEHYVQRLLRIGLREQSSRQCWVSIEELTSTTVGLIRVQADHAGVQLELSPGAPVGEGSVWCDPDDVRQALANLLINALEAVSSSDNSTRTVRLATLINRDEKWLTWEVADNGPGVSPQIAQRLFEPFATDRPDGTGLGLTFSRAVAAAHGGGVTLEHRDGWTVFRLSISFGPTAAA